MQKLKVLHLIKSLNRGGAETLLAEGLRFADTERFELSYGYFHPDLNALVPRLRDSGARVTCFGGTDPVGMLLRIRRVAKFLREHQIDLLHCHLPTAAAVGRIAAQLAKVPVVYTEHNKVEWYRRPTFWMNVLTYGLQDQVIAVSESVRESICKYIHPVVPVSVIRNGIDASRFDRFPEAGTAFRLQHGIAERTPIIGNVAALIPQKRLQDWLLAARMIHSQHPDAQFFLVGEGPQRGELLETVDRYGLQGAIHLPGSEVDVRPYLAAMDIYMMSSAYEGLPVAMLEAMAMRCVPVCTAVGGIPEVLEEDVNGFLTEPGVPEQLARKVGKLIDDPVRRSNIAAAARRTVEASFSLERMVGEVEALYRIILDPRRDGSKRIQPHLHVVSRGEI